MTARVFKTDGTIVRGRPCRSYDIPYVSDEATNRALVALSDRIKSLEQVARDPITALEYTLAVTATNTYTIAHNLNSVVRWYVVDWRSGSANTASFNRQSGTDLNNLKLLANTTGTAVVRVETCDGAYP